jgi:hypothetical protein
MKSELDAESDDQGSGSEVLLHAKKRGKEPGNNSINQPLSFEK